MRGVIQHAPRAQQIIDYRNLLYGRITPTDLDGIIEYKNKAYVFLEIKYGGKELPYGQRLALERLVRDTELAGKESIAIIAEHQVHDTEQPIMADACQVRELCYRQNHIWRLPKYDCTVKHLVDLFIQSVDRAMAI